MLKTIKLEFSKTSDDGVKAQQKFNNYPEKRIDTYWSLLLYMRTFIASAVMALIAVSWPWGGHIGHTTKPNQAELFDRQTDQLTAFS